MAAKKQTEKRVQNYPYLFPELGREANVWNQNTTKKPRRTFKSPRVGNCSGKNKTKREIQNKKLWESLYPITKNK